MKILLYNLFIFLYQTGARLLAPFNNKARLWLAGRRQWHVKLKRQMDDCQFHKKKNILWMHASSLGELEQGRPVLEKIRAQNPNCGIILSFFSPSGYEVMKNYESADIVCYLPVDTAENARRFMQIVQPTLVLWVKYEYWYHYLDALHFRNIPILLVSGIFRRDQPFFHWYGGLHRDMLGFFTHFFVQREISATLLQPLLKAPKKGLPYPITVSGDTRFDRVIEVAKKWTPVDPVKKWLAGAGKVVVAGSTWPEDEEELVHYVNANSGVRLIVAPHNLEPDFLKDTMNLFKNATLYSDLISNEKELSAESHVLIINNVGMLNRLYRYGNICYVGGGFTGDGVHNVLEAAVYGRPVVHGPEYEKYREAIELVEAGGSFEVENALEVEKVFSLLFSDPVAYQNAADAAESFVYRQAGGTQKILNYINENGLLNSGY